MLYVRGSHVNVTVTWTKPWNSPDCTNTRCPLDAISWVESTKDYHFRQKQVNK